MKIILLSILLTLALSLSANERVFDPEQTVTTEHSVTIGGKRVKYEAITGTQPLWNAKGETTAGLFFTYYRRTDVKQVNKRPLMFSFNGGPGSASVWMHLAYTGPKVLNISSEGFPVQPYGYKANPHSVLDVADIVFVNPVGTGYSRMLPNKEGELPSKEEQVKSFYSVNSDIKYLAEWMNTFVTRYERWTSPKFLIGESYGTTRVSGLALELQQKQSMYLNGVVLVSPTDLGLDRDGPVKAANRLPYFAATAWYHKVLPESLQNKEFQELISEVEEFTLNKYLPSLAKGAMLPESERQTIARQVSDYSGLSITEVLGSNLDIPTSYFWKALLRDQGYTVGRLDSRYRGIDQKAITDRPDYPQELLSWLHSFTPAINHYIRNELNYETDIKYEMLSYEVNSSWDRTGNKTGEQLRLAMASNPFLNVMVQSGYFDGATNYFDGKYNLWHLDPSGKMKDRLSFKGYMSGHMMYLRKEDLQRSNEDLRDFILNSLVAEGEPAKY